MYSFTTTEQNNEKASDYETKAMLYLFGCRKDSKDMDVFIIDCFNDVSGANRDVSKLWDVQSKGVKSLNPKKIGESLITLFQNYISDIEFECYILFMPKLKEMYLYDEDKTYFKIGNFKEKHQNKIKTGLMEEFNRRNKKMPSDDKVDDFLISVEFVIANEKKQAYIKEIMTLKKSLHFDEEFYDEIFNEIRNQQTILKTKNINGYQIMRARDVLKYGKNLWKKDIDALIINRILGMDLFNDKCVPLLFVNEIASLDVEEQKDMIQDCQSDIAKLLFDKNGRKRFWKFFGQLIDYTNTLTKKKPSDIFNQIKKDKVVIPKTLSENSVKYLIAALEEGSK